MITIADEREVIRVQLDHEGSQVSCGHDVRADNRPATRSLLHRRLIAIKLECWSRLQGAFILVEHSF